MSSSETDFFLESYSDYSRRTAIFEDNGTSGWLYLTAVESSDIAKDAWVHNRIPAPNPADISKFRPEPPPAAKGYAGAGALCQDPKRHLWQLIWARDGNAVALLKDGMPVAFISESASKGCSRELLKDGPWGLAWSEKRYETLFPDAT